MLPPIIAPLLAWLASSPAHAGEIAVVGDSGGDGVECVPLVAGGTPLLQGFGVDYRTKDRHLLAFTVDTQSDVARDGFGQDHRDAVCVEYFDNFLPDPFRSGVEYVLEARPGAVLEDLRGSCSGGACTVALTPPGEGQIFVLTGFEFWFTETQGSIGFFWRPSQKDHHLGTVAILPSDAQDALTVHFADDDEDDPYGFRISYAWVPSAYVRDRRTVTGQGTGGFGSSNAGVTGGEGLLRGFMLTFGTLRDPRGADHHTDEIAVRVRLGLDTPRVETAFNDDNDDDRFEWRVDFAAVRATPVGPIRDLENVLEVTPVR